MSPRLVDLLSKAGHDVIHLQQLNLLGHSDAEVMAAAKADERVLVSSDTDFGELLATGGAVAPSLILFRQGNRGPEHHAETINANLDAVADDLAEGAVVVFTEDRIRIRRLPVN
jgi:predicted nuclease of predicted toxin-antitoxin system